MDGTVACIDRGPPPAQAEDVGLAVGLAVGKEYRTFGEAVGAVHRHVSRIGMPKSSLCVKTQDVIKKDEAMELFGVPNHDGKAIYRRFQFYCNHNGTCPYRIPVSFFKRKKVFRILDHGGHDEKKIGTTAHNINHDHTIEAMTVSLEDGTVLVKNEGDLTLEEEAFIKEKSLELIGMSKMQLRLRENFLGRSFDSQMLHRIKNSHLNAMFGKDRHRLPQLMQKGEATKAKGGVWEPIICTNTFRLQGTNYQEVKMREYAEEFGQCCTFADGTHGTNVYGIVTVPFTTVDSLGLSVISGISTMLNENSVDIIRSCGLFGLSGRLPDKSEVRILSVIALLFSS